MEKIAVGDFEIMFEFIRASVLEREPDISQNKEVDWDRLMDISAGQGILALVWDGICKLPMESQPPRQQRINWGLSAQSYWDDYKKKKETLTYILKVCGENNIKLLLLKGIGLSMLYPKPQSRMAGDIDIFLFDDYQKGNIVFSGKRIQEKSKHSTIIINGVSVENHRTFLEPNTSQKRRIIKYIKSSLGDARLMPENYWILSPLPNLIFLTFHTLKHFNGGKQVPIKNIIDFAIFLKHNMAELHPVACHEALSKVKLINSFELLICLSERILNIVFEEYHYAILPQELLEGLNKELSYGRNELSNSSLYYLSQYIPKNYGLTIKTLMHIFVCNFLCLSKFSK